MILHYHLRGYVMFQNEMYTVRIVTGDGAIQGSVNTTGYPLAFEGRALIGQLRNNA